MNISILIGFILGVLTGSLSIIYYRNRYVKEKIEYIRILSNFRYDLNNVVYMLQNDKIIKVKILSREYKHSIFKLDKYKDLIYSKKEENSMYYYSIDLNYENNIKDHKYNIVTVNEKDLFRNPQELTDKLLEKAKKNESTTI